MPCVSVVTPPPWDSISMISQPREPEMLLFLSLTEPLSLLANSGHLSSSGEQSCSDWLCDKASAIMFPLQLTTSNFYCSNLLLPPCRKSAQNSQATEQKLWLPGHSAWALLRWKPCCRSQANKSLVQNKLKSRNPEFGLNHLWLEHKEAWGYLQCFFCGLLISEAEYSIHKF